MDKYLTGIAPDEVTNAWKYEDELDDKGILPDEPHGDAAWKDFPRIHYMAEQGDKKAIDVLQGLKDINERRSGTSSDTDINEDDTQTEDELFNLVKNGNGSIIQTVKMPDGSEREIAAWGGYEFDGYDRTLNVFIKAKDIHEFAQRLLEGKIVKPDIEDPCDKEKGYQITIDYLDLYATTVIRRGEGKLTVTMYERDERRSYRNIIELNSGELELDENNECVKTVRELLKMLEDNDYILYVLDSVGIRNYLLNEGIVQKLYDMYDESAGVLIELSESGEITSRIVKGEERPDLICSVPFIGEEYCRPYIDEVLGLKSPSVRKHFTDNN